jgi:hypothetical protein
MLLEGMKLRKIRGMGLVERIGVMRNTKCYFESMKNMLVGNLGIGGRMIKQKIGS